MRDLDATLTLAGARPRLRPRSGLLGALAQMHGRWRQRQALARLDEDALRDIGVTRDQVAAEMRRPPWC